MRPAVSIATLLLVLCAAGMAQASCLPPPPGVTRIDGVVREAAGGAAVCIQTGPDHRLLTRLKLRDVQAPPLTGPGGEGAKWALRRVARGRQVSCRITGPGVGVCRVGSASIADLLRANGRG